MDEQHYPEQDVAKLFKVSIQTIRRWTREGKLPKPLKFGRKTMHPKQGIDELYRRGFQ